MSESNKKSGKVSWCCPSNIALVKYWGKHGQQLPNNASLSITLENAHTETEIDYEFVDTLNQPDLTFSFGNQNSEVFGERISRFIEKLLPEMPFLNHIRMQITSRNSFPHSAGIASSASAFGSLALCICSMEEQLLGQLSGNTDFFQKASALARLGSGSACRSIYGGYVVWGQHVSADQSSDQYGIAINPKVHEIFRDMQDSILIVSSEKKKVSSSEGHALMDHHPYARTRYQLAESRITEFLEALTTGDMDRFIRLTEMEALGLHALMMLSESSYVLIKPNTLQIIEKVRKFRLETGIPLCFTLDAGPNVHLLYPGIYKEDIRYFISEELLDLCEHRQWIHDHIGPGPVQM